MCQITKDKVKRQKGSGFWAPCEEKPHESKMQKVSKLKGYEILCDGKTGNFKT